MRLKRALVTFISLIVVAVGFFSVPVNGDSPQPDVLLVKDAHRDPEGLGRDMNKLLAPYYINAIKSVNPPGPQTSLDYDNCTISDTQGEGPDWDSSGGCDERIGGLKNYDIVIWFTGNDGTACEIPTLQPQDPGSSDKCPDVGVYGDDRLQLKKFLENGGTLFVSGENIGHDREYYWDVYNNFDFYQDYLKADPDIIDSDNQGWRKDIEAGANNDPIGDGMAYPEDIYLTGSGGAGNWEHPDYIWEVDYPVLAYAQIYGYWIRSAVRGNTGGPDGFKSVFFSFSFASINSSMKREKLMRRIHYYLSAPSTLNGNLWMDKIEGSGWTGWNITCDRWNDGFCLRNSNPPKVNATCVNKQLFTDVQDSQWRVEGTGYSDNLGAANGTYYEDDVIFVNGTIDISGLEAPGQVGSYTLKVRCQDESDFWGQNDTYHFGVDRYYPRFVDEEVNISEGRDYTDKVKPNIMVELYDAAWDEFNVEPENYNYFRFSCNKTDWTEWKSYQKPYSDFNITDPDYGCDTGNGNRTVYVQLRDKAGNFKSSVIGKDWIVLDRKAPQITSITPQNDSYIRPEDNITVTFRDSAPQDGKRSGVSQSLFDNETYNISFNNNTEFNHGWSSAGVINADIFLKDGVGNLNVTSYRFRVDDMPPSTYDNATGLFSNNSNYFNNWHWYGSNQTVSLICDDPDISSGVSGSGCNVTLYCLNDTESGSCSPHIHGKSKEVGCSEGEVCVQWMVYRSNDTLNNTETPKISANISIDKKAPNVSIDEPSGWVRGWIDLNATVLDQTPGSGVDTALYNLSNSTWSDSGELTQGAGGFYTKDLDTTQLAGGPYNVTFLANDSVGNKNYTQRINITVDNTPPDVTLEEPIDAWIANQTPLFNFTPSDGLAPELNCTLVVNGLRNASIIVQNGSTDGTRPTGPIPEGKGHEWNVNCTDKAGNSEKPQYPKKFDIDVTKPGITLNLPENETWIATKEPTFNFTPSDNLASELECIAYANQSVQKGGANFTLDGPKLIYSDPIQEGSQPWWINCTDKAGNRRKSLERTINIDVSGPNTTDNSTGIWSPENKTILLSCEDLPSQNPVGCNETYYCVGSSCEDFESVPTNETPKGRAEVNYTLELGCVEGEIFEEKISYRSNDSLANLEGVKTSSYPVRIDKQDPSTWDNVSSIWRNSNETVKLSCTDSGSGCNFTSYCINSSELSCQYSSEPANFSLEVGCPQGEVCRKQVVYYSNDSVNNTEDAGISANISIDKANPSVTINEPSGWVRGWIDLNATTFDQSPGAGIDEALYNLSNSTWSDLGTLTNESGNLFWTSSYDSTTRADGPYNITFLANDTAGNRNETQWTDIQVDNTPPTTSDNISGEWRNTNKSVELNCTDAGIGRDALLYCIDTPGTCNPSINYTAPFEVGCSEKETCKKYVRYNCNDTLGNQGLNKTATVRIDKENPQIAIDSPTAGGTRSGTIDLKTTITDTGIGVNISWYQVLNASDLSQVFANGTLEETNDWDTSWDSVDDIPTGTAENATFNVSANDTLGNTRYNVNVTFEVDNRRPEVKIIRPEPSTFLNSSFSLNLTAIKTANNISYAQYNITNATNPNWNKTNETAGGLDVTSYTFTDFINLSVWSDGNYTLNFTSNDTANNWGQDFGWFGIDRVPPDTGDDTDPLEPWYGENQTVNLTCYPGSGVNASCDTTLHCVNSTANPSCTPNLTSTLFEVGCLEGNTCRKQVPYKSNDTAGNREDLETSNLIKIDKEAPASDDNVSGQWKGENQTIRLNCTDDGIGCDKVKYCVGAQGCPLSQVANISLGEETFEVGCPNGGVCEKWVRYQSNDSLGNLEGEKTSSYPVRIDKQDPSTWDNVSSIWRNSNETVKLSCTDSGSGCNFTSYCINSSELSCQYSSEPANFSLEVGCPQGEVCRKQVVYYSNDSVNNTEDANLSSPIRIDKRAPHMKAIKLNISVDQTFNQSRVYPGDGVKFFLNASDVVNISKILVTLNTPTQPPANKTLSLGPGNLSRGRWSFVYTPQNLGLYNFTQLYANDSLGNMNASLSANKQFRVVNATLEVKLDSGSAVNAGFNSSFNASLKLNKTFEAPFARLFVPPNTYANTSQEPWFTNLSTYQCSFNKSGGGCQIATGNDSQSAPTYLNLSGAGNGTNFSLENPTIEVETPLQDVNATWLARFHRFTYHNKTKIKTPLLNISQILCDGSSPCIVDQLAGFNLTVVVENVQEPAHTGLAKGVNVKFETDAPANLTRNTSSLGDVGSGEQNSTQWGINISEAGKYTLTLRSWDTTGSYNTSRKKTIEVKDILEPEIINLSWKDNNLFNVNETVNYTVEAKDNTGVDEVWLSTNKSNFLKNHTLSRYKGSPTYGSWRLSYNNTTSPGTYGIVEIYANDSNSNIENVTPTGDLSKFKVRNILLNASLSHEKMEINTSQTFYLNVTGNASQISKVKATVQKPHDVNESVELSLEEGLNTSPYETYKFVGTYENATFSRNYTANMNVTLSSGVWRATSVDFNVSFGNVSLEPEREVLTLPENATYKLSWYVIPSDGDLTGVNASLNITNKSLVNLSSQVSKTKNLGDIYWEEYGSEGHETKWEINTSSTTGETNLTLRVNSTTPSTPISGQNESGEMKIEVIEEDDTKPTIEEVWLEWSVVNLNHMQKIWVNATDEKTVVKKEALVEISWPSGAKKNLTAEKTKEGLYKLEFSQINETGNYSFRTIVYDVAGNKNASGWKNFSASDEYLVNVVTSLPRRNESISKYNKEENVSIRVDVSTVNELTVNDFNLTLKVYNATGNETLLNHTAKERGYYFIREANKPLQTGSVGDINHPTYYAYAEVSGSGNSGGNKTSFDVYKYLSTDFKNPDKGEYFKAGASINVSISVTNIRGEEVKDAVVTAYCSDCPEKKQIRLEYSPNSSYVTPSSFEAPSEDFSIDATSLDPGKNKDPDGVHPYVPLNSGTPPPGGAPPREGGEGGAAAPLPKIEVLGPPRRLPSTADETWLKVRTDRAGECEYSSKDFSYGNGTDFEESNGTLHKAKVKVSAGQSYYYRIKCKVGERISEDSVAFSVKPKMIKKFKTEYEHTVLVPRGENATVWVDFINIGDKTVTVVPTARSECCDLGFAVREVEIRPGSRRSVKLGVHVPLSIHPGNYTSFLTFKSGKVERERIIQIGVSEHLLTRKLSEINSSVPKLREDLKDLEKVGLDVSSLKEKLEDVQRLVKEGEEAIQSDDLEELRAKVKEAQRKKNQIEGKIGGLKFKQFLLENKWNILAAILTFFFGSYLLTQLLIPWYRLGKTVSSLEEEKEESIQTRKKAEKQYFRREIDEPTFRDIMTEEQDKILHLRGEVEKNKKRLDTLVSRALSPRKILVFPVNSARKLYQKSVELKERKEGFREYLVGGMSTLREDLEEIGGMEIGAGAKVKSWVFRVPEALAEVFQKIKPTKKRGKAVREYGKKKEFKRPEEEKEKEFEEEAEPELEGIEKPEERVSKVTEIRKRIEKEREKDKNE